MSEPSPHIDWDAVAAETTELLAQMIRIDTSNPPGNEYLACDWLEGILRREGFEPERYDPGGGRHSIRAVYRGDGSKRPLLLLSHSDVVPCEPEKWQEPPFAGVVRDGVLWGRGALDDKGLAVMGLVTLLVFKRLGLKTRRDLVYLCTADEEAGSQLGVEYLDREHPEVFDVEYVFNEGAFGMSGLLGMERPLFGFSPTEKGPMWVRLSTEGRSGHGSVPLPDNCVERLAKAIARVVTWERPYRVLPETQPLFDALADAGLLPKELDQQTLAGVAGKSLMLRARMIDGISTTKFQAGYKDNVIPSRAEATLDIRLLPGTKPEEFLQRLVERIDDPGVKVEHLFVHESIASPVESEPYRVFQGVVREYVEDARFSPMVDAFFTDSRTFRRRGIAAYGFNPVLLTEEEIGTLHGHNERISLENIRLGTQIYFEVCRRMCV